MVFVDNVALELLILFFSGMLIIYTTINIYREKKDNKKPETKINIIPLFILGLFIFINGIAEEIMWPLPGSYNILFYDPFVLFGMILLGFSISIALKQKLSYIGFFAFLSGIITGVYGLFGYLLNMTQSPQMLLALYVLFGISGIFAYPSTLIYDSNKKSKMHLFILILFWVFLFLASLTALVLGTVALNGHLKTTP